MLDAVRAGGDAGAPALLAEYQRQRRGANLLMLGATDALDRLFSTDNPSSAASAIWASPGWSDSPA